jgi:hypothetical protein
MKRNELTVGTKYAWDKAQTWQDRLSAKEVTLVDLGPFSTAVWYENLTVDGETNRVKAIRSDKGQLVAIRAEGWGGKSYVDIVPMSQLRITWADYVEYRERRREQDQIQIQQDAASAKVRRDDRQNVIDQAKRHGIRIDHIDFDDVDYMPLDDINVLVNVGELKRLLAIADQAAATQES